VAEAVKWQNRIVGYGVEDADQLLANPSNWRIHPKFQQDSLSGILDTVGWVQNVIVNKRLSPIWGQDRNVETVVDGHLRIALAISRNEQVPVTYVDLDPTEEALILASIDPIAALAATDRDQLDALLKSVNTDSVAIQQLLTNLATRTGIIPPDNPYDHWDGMPEFEQEDKTALKSIQVHFASEDDLEQFAKAIAQTITMQTRSIWYPPKAKEDLTKVKWVSET
jgi:hypothetical protein